GMSQLVRQGENRAVRPRCRISEIHGYIVGEWSNRAPELPVGEATHREGVHRCSVADEGGGVAPEAVYSHLVFELGAGVREVVTPSAGVAAHVQRGAT